MTHYFFWRECKSFDTREGLALRAMKRVIESLRARTQLNNVYIFISLNTTFKKNPKIGLHMILSAVLPFILDKNVKYLLNPTSSQGHWKICKSGVFHLSSIDSLSKFSCTCSFSLVDISFTIAILEN